MSSTQHAAALAHAQAVFRQWGTEHSDETAFALDMLELLASCERDGSGDRTLDVIEAIVEEFAEEVAGADDEEDFDAMPEDLSTALDRLRDAAHALGQQDLTLDDPSKETPQEHVRQALQRLAILQSVLTEVVTGDASLVDEETEEAPAFGVLAEARAHLDAALNQMKG